MISIYLMIGLIGLILLIIFALMGGFGAMVGGDVDAGGHSFGHDTDASFGHDTDASIGHDTDSGPSTVTVDTSSISAADASIALSASVSPFSPSIIFTFLTLFGGIGWALEFSIAQWYVVLVITIAVSFAITTAVFFTLTAAFKHFQATSLIPMSKLVGMTAQVTIRIRPGTEGQVLVIREERGRMLLAAIADEDLIVDETVLIAEVDGSTVKVKRKSQSLDLEKTTDQLTS